MNEERRDFLGMALGGVAGIGGIAALYAAKRSWDPLPSVAAAGFITLDLSSARENQLHVDEWRGKPIFVLKKSADMPEDDRDVVLEDGSRFHISIALCTHLGCIPAYNPSEQEFLCACHGGRFDTAGNEIFGPPPSPLEIPPFKVDGMSVILGEEGEQYERMLSAGITE